jgi:hypothetical protein
MTSDKKYLLGQYFTEPAAVDRSLRLVKEFIDPPPGSRVLEPSAGTGNFVEGLKKAGFRDVTACEIDPALTSTPQDFFLYPLSEKFDLIIGNPPFSNYNVARSYFFPEEYQKTAVPPRSYLPAPLAKKEKTRMEDAFILKTLAHLKDNSKSSVGYVLPLSFFIKGRSLEVKKELVRRFSTMVIYQTDARWVREGVPCCFAIFSNVPSLARKAVLIFEDSTIHKATTVSLDRVLDTELVPKSFLYKESLSLVGTPLSEYLEPLSPRYKKSFTVNNVSAKNILSHAKIPPGGDPSGYALAVTRVGDASVGKSGLVDLESDVLNDMFYVFKFKPGHDDRETKEAVCAALNENTSHFKNLTYRTGSKSLKRDDVLEFRVNLTNQPKTLLNISSTHLISMQS